MNKRTKTAPSNLLGFGFDYGLGITATAVGSMEFNKNLVDAGIIAVAYGFDYSQTLGARVPAITLLGRNEHPLRKAFEEFSNWASCTDADAIEITLVFTKEGGYRLCINPEITAFYKRVFRYDTVVNPMAFQLIWIKPIDTISKALIDMRRILSTGIIRPFLLQAARYSGISLSAKAFNPRLIEPISFGQELLKFEISFVDEDSADNPLWQRIAQGDHDPDSDSTSVDTSTPKPLVWTRRKEAIKRLFPVTLWRSRSLETTVALRRAAGALGLFEWQIDQALCNLLLSQEIADGKYHFRGLPKRDWPDQLWNALGDRFEVADATQLDFQQLEIEKLVHQAILDARVLLKHYGVKRVPKKLKRVQYMLQQRNLHWEPDE